MVLNNNIIGFTIGILLLVTGCAELFSALIDYSAHYSNYQVFLFCSVISLFFGGAFVTAHKSFNKDLKIKQVFLLTTMCWISISLFAALPLYFSNLDISFTDAFFESVSGITTTGSTVLSGLDSMSPGILVWRSFTQWIGGIGIIAFAILILPFLDSGGMQLFKAESSDRSEKALPRTHILIASLIGVYAGLTIICALTYFILGMSFFDAFNHAMTTIPTGGYSTHDASFGYFESSALQYAGAFFMICGSIPFVLYIRAVREKKFIFWESEQVRSFIYILCVIIGFTTIWLWANSVNGLSDSLRLATFNIISVITTTGYATADYTLWGSFAVIVFLFTTYMGACTGSTTGGIKVMRLVIAIKCMNNHMKNLIYPNGVFPLKFQNRPVSADTKLTVMSFLSLYVAANVVLTVLLCFTGLDFQAAIGGAATAIANVGPGLDPVLGPAGNFSSIPEAAKWLLAAGMLLGRLEILTVLVLFNPAQWKW